MMEIDKMISVIPFQAATDMPKLAAGMQQGQSQSGPSSSGLFSSLLNNGVQNLDALKTLVGDNKELLAQLQSGNLVPLDELELPLEDIQIPLEQLLTQDLQQLIRDKKLFVAEDMSMEDIVEGLELVLNPEDLAVLQSIMAQVEDLKQNAPEVFAKVEDLFQSLGKSINKEIKASAALAQVDSVFASDSEGVEEALAKIDLSQTKVGGAISTVLKQVDKSIVADVVATVKGANDPSNLLQGFDELLATKMVTKDVSTPVINKQSFGAQNFVVEQQVATSAWEQAIGGRLTFMAKNGVTVAKLHLKPAEMGPIEITVKMREDQASISFNAHHANTREALEVAIPRLREMFAQSGLNLAEADVQSGASHAHAENDSGSNRSNSASADSLGYGADVDDETETVIEASMQALGLVDSYA